MGELSAPGVAAGGRRLGCSSWRGCRRGCWCGCRRGCWCSRRCGCRCTTGTAGYIRAGGRCFALQGCRRGAAQSAAMLEFSTMDAAERLLSLCSTAPSLGTGHQVSQPEQLHAHSRWRHLLRTRDHILDRLYAAKAPDLLMTHQHSVLASEANKHA